MSSPNVWTLSSEDEGVHPAVAQPLWSESWYADFVDPGRGIGGWVRLGRMPTERATWVQIYLCGPDMPTVVISEMLAEVAEDPWAVRTPDLEFTHTVPTPWHRYRVTARGRARVYDDPAAIFESRGTATAALDIDLEWSTDGDLYPYRITPRYEIPCRVSGTVSIDGRAVTLHGVLGQRDHSWGPRDWWSMDWTWSALHLEDGSHSHAVHIRLPGIEVPGVGYLQTPGRPLVELTDIRAVETFTADGLVARTTLTATPDLHLVVETAGHAPVPVVAADGRVSRFLRGWGTVTASDGRRGYGWVECNLSPAPPAGGAP
ncbi:DUF7064 domain-containing protein [Nocardia bovistercoris]|uniref:AttH domain-containing protein n=1 Tax=Nocardia bovistercoris TaxID=2785916 RepID=A0A931N272_9NOCA|nr:hypothetical protein [Nocardia bovistercoris]MBH0776452.1 hypothetical protein [Nocardia bovistercoris]